jgi:hypothetical protein
MGVERWNWYQITHYLRGQICFTILYNYNSFFPAPVIPESCMPLGMKADDNKTKLVPVQPGEQLFFVLFSLDIQQGWQLFSIFSIQS